MLFDTYEEKGMLVNTNIKESSGDYAAYRGDLVLTLGEVGDAFGHRKPPLASMKNAVVLAQNDKIVFSAGGLDDLPAALGHVVGGLKRAGRGPV